MVKSKQLIFRSNIFKVVTECFLTWCIFPLINPRTYQPSVENLEVGEWFEEDTRYGLFVHREVYSILGDGEWVMNNQNISVDIHAKLPTFSAP